MKLKFYNEFVMHYKNFAEILKDANTLNYNGINQMKSNCKNMLCGMGILAISLKIISYDEYNKLYNIIESIGCYEKAMNEIELLVENLYDE